MIHRFSDWAAAGFYNALVASPAMNERALLAEMAGTVGQLNSFVTSIDRMSKGLDSLTDFSSQMQTATDGIVDAINKLPDTVNASVNESVNNLSSASRCAGLAEALEHYTTYLTRLIEIYGDHGIMFKDMHDFIG